jgi:hypothetical protein
MMSENIHTYPTTDEHLTSGLDCWCSPAYLLPCDECEDGCWKCVGGAIPQTRAVAETADRPIIVVHNR